MKWTGLKQTGIQSVTCCPQLARLADGRIALLWNAPPRHDPTHRGSRAELSLAFSSDEATTWSKPIIVAANYAPGSRVSYPYLYERQPGELWITTMQGGLRMKVQATDLEKAEIPRYVAPKKADPKPGGIVLFGDSTTAPRANVKKVYADRVDEALQGIGSSLSVHNAGLGGNTTRDALKRFEPSVLRHQPRVIVIQFGINDSAVDVWKKPPATASRVPLKEYLDNLRTMIAAAQKQKAKVILMTPNPLRWTPKLIAVYGKAPYHPDAEDGFESATLVPYVEALRALATELKVPLVDVHAAYPKSHADALLLDGMHPNDKGHELVAELLVPVIREALR